MSAEVGRRRSPRFVWMSARLSAHNRRPEPGKPESEQRVDHPTPVTRGGRTSTSSCQSSSCRTRYNSHRSFTFPRGVRQTLPRRRPLPSRSCVNPVRKISNLIITSARITGSDARTQLSRRSWLLSMFCHPVRWVRISVNSLRHSVPSIPPIPSVPSVKPPSTFRD